ncbi:MAG: hypothetical protein U1B83_03090 [Candidatus Cloacimonadaceae bacterium]|nr:hypothetical protein [Candidatus Cloacimonadaceae bacterium]
MKRICLLLLMFVIASYAMAMISDYYNPPVASAGTYSAIAGTVPAVSGNGYFPDEELTVPIPLGFTFNYCGVSYTQVKMSTNGYLAMGTNHTWFYSYENMLASTNSSYYPFVAPLWDDLQCDAMTYTTTGSAPNRVFTAQWANAMWDWNGTPGQNFQVKLYETSDKIEFIYGPLITPNDPSATIGLNMAPGGAGNFYSITPGATISYSTTMENDNINSITYLSQGTTYTFNRAMASVPNPAVAVYPLNGATSVSIAANLMWASGGGIPTGYRLMFGTNGAGVTPPNNIVSNLDLGANTSYDPSPDMATNTMYYWQVVPYNASGSATGCPIWSFTTGGQPLRGDKTIDPAGSGPDNFTSITAAINALNSLGVGQDGVTFNLPAGLTFNEATAIPAITTTGTQANPITFQKSGAGANPLVTIPGTTGNSDAVFKLSGASYVTFDGIDIANSGTATNLEYGYWLTDTAINGGSSFNVIKNSTITLNRSNVNSIGVYSIITSSPNNNNNYQNITINTAYNGIWIQGLESVGEANLIIQGCVFNSIAEHSMHLDYQTGANVFDNVVNYPTSEPCASTIYGFYSYGLQYAAIYNNAFSGGNVSRAITNIFLNWSGQCEVHHNTISGTITTGVWYIGIYASQPQWGTINIHHNNIHDISTGMIIWAIYTMRGYNININDNNIYNLTTGNIFWGIHAIENMGLEYAANIYNNKIHNIHLTGETYQITSAINVQDIYANIYNNMVYDIKAPNTNAVSADPQVCGISLLDMQVTQGERANVYNNSVLLTATGTGNSTTACFFTTFAGPVDLKNNIFVNNSVPGATGRAVAFWKRGVSFDNFVATMDKNIYYAGTPDARHLIYYDGTNSSQTLDDYKALNVGKDQGSYWENVPFVSAVAPFDLHINPSIGTNVEGNAIYLPAVVVDDIDGDIRSMTPDIGADEGDFTALSLLATPANVSVMLFGASVQISWNAVAGATGYYIYGADQPDAAMPWGTPLQTVLAPNTTATLSPTSQFKFYYVTAYQ